MELFNPCHDPMYITVVRFDGPPLLRCEYCHQVPVPDVYAYVSQLARSDLQAAIRLAHVYYDITGDDQVPMPFAVVDVEGILPSLVVDQTLKRVVTAVRILRALNAPFTRDEAIQSPTEDMKGFVDEYMQVLMEKGRVSTPRSNVDLVLDNLLQQVGSVMQSNNFKENQFDFYFHKLVPYVKLFHGRDDDNLPPVVDNHLDFATQLLHQLHRSQAIRKTFGQFNMAFDVFHVLVACYACGTESNVVANWTLDLVARICRGRFFWKRYESCPLVRNVVRMLKTEVTYKRNTEMYYVMRQIQKGEGIECLSENFVQYGQLEKLVHDRLEDGPLREAVLGGLFPSVLFDHQADQLAFVVGMSHVGQNLDVKTGQVRKGAYGKARKLYRIASDVVKMVEAFDAGTPMPWTMDTLKLFLASDEKVDKYLQELASVMVINEDDN